MFIFAVNGIRRESVGHRCLARGLSDLAAMGARPEAAFLSLALPQELAGEWMERFFNGLMALAERCQVPLAGGDTAKAPMVIADIVLLGSVPKGEALLRSGARAGDLLYVTGLSADQQLSCSLLSSSRRSSAGRDRGASTSLSGAQVSCWPESPKAGNGGYRCQRWALHRSGPSVR